MGWGVEKNEDEALKWYRKAPAQGLKAADDMIKLLQRSRRCIPKVSWVEGEEAHRRRGRRLLGVGVRAAWV